MSIRLEMLQAARAAPTLLREARELVIDFVLRQAVPAGGFKGRSEASDLYYTLFAIECLRALQAEMPVDRLTSYLRAFGDGESLDFVHLCCLARSWAHLAPISPDAGVRAGIAERIHRYHTPDGGYSQEKNAEMGTAYGCFLALGAYQDVERDVPDEEALVAAVRRLEADDHAFGNAPNMRVGATPPTAAAVIVLAHVGEPIAPSVGSWLLARCQPSGGFLAVPEAPAPDLLSTATALHALGRMKVPLDHIREPCLDFIDSLWSADGGFYGTWADKTLDCEYTYYGLLALGNLARAEG